MAKAGKHSVDYSRGYKDSHCGKVFGDDTGYCPTSSSHRAAQPI
jgi:hypothetical protein